MTQQNERNKNEMGEYVVFLIESGYAEWDERVGACVFNEGVDTKGSNEGIYEENEEREKT